MTDADSPNVVAPGRFIPHFALTADSLPSPDAPWSELVYFAGTFDGYAVAPSEGALQHLVSEGRRQFHADGALPAGLTMLRTALHGEQRANYWSEEGPPGAREMDYIRALVEGIRQLVLRGAHLAPQQWSPGGVRDKLINAFDRLLVGYASWGGHRFHGWTAEDDASNYLGPVIWSERDCGLRFALELEKEWPGATHMEFALGKSTLADFDVVVEKGQRVDIAVSDQSAFVEDATSQARFLRHHHQAFVEVKWFKKGWRDGAFKMEGPKRIREIQDDVTKLERHARLNRCEVAAMLVFDDEGYFQERKASIEWPAQVWRLVAGSSELRLRGLLPPEQ